jgi:DNA-binding transcriptional ArsR family regulator
MSARPASARTGAKASAAKAALPAFAATLAALGDETRLRLVARLSTEGPLSIARLADGADVTRQGITKHLHVLSSAGLVHGVRHGREQIWELDPKRLNETRRYLDRISDQWDDALARLKRLVER